MKTKQGLNFKVTALLLTIALLLPFTTEALHLIAHNNHIHCTETGTTHFHQQELECDLFDFQLSTVFHLFIFESEEQQSLNFKSIFPSIEDYYFNSFFITPHLRGPPVNA
ncbi:hypothetical protein [Planktosalinus lacus]|uniref:Uncharacterized protein n=1 Tax=Planktosalinus lacus TaxID=1526573 RepID=A0A8J2Y8G2_9FLAO|nr:hypothetical protein [Planktosalinus lacus]GGD92952.1 hypothetical protein GCM10011312_15930 [Planktosalinus lacus]